MEKVEDEGDFGEDKVRASPEHDVGKVEEVEAVLLAPHRGIKKMEPRISETYRMKCGPTLHAAFTQTWLSANKCHTYPSWPINMAIQ